MDARGREGGGEGNATPTTPLRYRCMVLQISHREGWSRDFNQRLSTAGPQPKAGNGVDWDVRYIQCIYGERESENVGH